jgi:O-antigen ligase
MSAATHSGGYARGTAGGFAVAPIATAWSLAAAFVLAVVGFPFISTVPVMLALPSTVATVPFRGLVLAITLWILFRWLVAGARVYSGFVLAPMLALWTLLVARMLWDTMLDPLPRPTLPEAPQWVALAIGGTLLPALAFLEKPNDRTLRAAARGIEWLGVASIAMVFWLGLTSLRAGAIFQRLATETLNPISVGHLGASVFIVAACRALDARAAGTRPPWWRRWVRIVTLGLALAAVVASFSRGPAAALAFAAAVLMIFHPGFAGSPVSRLVAGTAIVSVVATVTVAVVLYLEQNALINALFRLSQGLQDTASNERLQMFEGALQQFAENPLLGQHFVELRWMTYPHNMVLETMMATGLVGLVLLAICLGAGTWYAWQLVRGGGHAVWVGLLFFQYALAQLASGSILLAGTFWAMLIACCVLGADRGARGATLR